MSSYDFIVLGGGPAGAVIASRLSHSKAKPTVLLLEAGGENADPELRLLAERFQSFMKPELNWGYKTMPQETIGGNQLDYSRGKGLGGSTAANFCCWTVGPRDDYDEWARQVGDEFFNWDNMTARRKKIETFHDVEDEKYRPYFQPAENVHGDNGPLSIEVAKVWENDYTDTLDAIAASGMPINKDMNSGDPIGIGVSPSTAAKSWRATAANAFLQDRPANLTVKTNTFITKINFDGKKANSLSSDAGETFTATKEIILCAGSIDTPKLLLLSGVGPEEEISKHNIPLQHALPGIGQNLQDHPFLTMCMERKAGVNDRHLFADSKYSADARKMFIENGTGPMAQVYGLCMFGWEHIDNELTNSEEYKSLPEDIKRHISYQTVPVRELIMHAPPAPPFLDQSKTYLPFMTVLMCPQSTGTVTLASTNPQDAPLCDPKILQHPFDLLNFKLTVRKSLKIVQSAGFSKDNVGLVLGPKSDSDEDIMEYAKTPGVVGTTWHMSGTAKMGKADDDMACVDSHFRVKGLEGLRIADMSVAPFVLNCHVQAVAYTIGESAAERLIDEYKLDS